MDVIRERFHALREALGVDDQIAGLVPTWSNAFLNDQILITQIAHAGCHQRIGLIPNCLFIVCAEVTVPGWPIPWAEWELNLVTAGVPP